MDARRAVVAALMVAAVAPVAAAEEEEPSIVLTGVALVLFGEVVYQDATHLRTVATSACELEASSFGALLWKSRPPSAVELGPIYTGADGNATVLTPDVDVWRITYGERWSCNGVTYEPSQTWLQQ